MQVSNGVVYMSKGRKLIRYWIIFSGMISCILLFTGFKNNRFLMISESVSVLKEITTASYFFVNKERVNGKLLSGKQYIKWSANPFMCYLYFIEPSEGAELIYCQDKNNNEAIYRPNGFPYVNLSLDPFGDMMRKNNHHTIYETGLWSFISILHSIISNPNYIINELGVESINNIQCAGFESVNKNFCYSDYILTKKENIRSLAKRKILNDYIVSTKNSVDALKELDKGTRILIPNSYAKKIKLWIDIQTKIPVLLEFYDEQGMFERYEIQNLVINPFFNDMDFTEDALGKQSY